MTASWIKVASILLVSAFLLTLTAGACAPIASSSAVSLEYQADFSQLAGRDQEQVMDDTLTMVKARLAAAGIKKSNVSRAGQDRIVVQMTEADYSDALAALISSSTILEFREQVELKDDSGNVTGEKWVPATAVINGEEKALNSNYFKSNTFVTRNEFGQVLLVFEWTSEGAQISRAVTTRLLNKPLGIFEGSGEDAQPLLGDNGEPIAPTVQAVITDKGEITGLSFNEATQLSKQLNAGRLPISLVLMAKTEVHK